MLEESKHGDVANFRTPDNMKTTELWKLSENRPENTFVQLSCRLPDKITVAVVNEELFDSRRVSGSSVSF
jgi:hypothetical protein